MKIFVSYTTRDSHINREFLASISEVTSSFGTSYVDLLDNNALDKQAYVETMLTSSDVLLLLSSQSIEHSKWVKWELTQAKKLNIPIIRIKALDKNINTVRSNIVSEVKLFIEESQLHTY